MRVAGVDVGGTNITAAAVDDDGTVVDAAKTDTPREGAEAVCRAVVHAVEQLADVEAVGVGLPGPVTADGVVPTAPNLSGFDQPVPVRELVAARLPELPVVVANDADAGAVGEWAHGAAKGSRVLLAAWLGTGVGGAVLLDGEPFTGAFGGAGELGHVVAQPRGAECGCGRRGCLEAYAGRASMERAARRAAERGERTLLLEYASAKGSDRIKSGMWAKAVRNDDPVATRLLTDAVDALGSVVGSLINLLDFDTVVVGGGFAEKLGQGLADRIAAAAAPVILLREPDRRFVVAELGDDAGVVGLAELARRRLAET